MSASIDINQAIGDARALLDTLLSSEWQDVHIVSGDAEIFIARDGGRPNPMRQAAVGPAVAAPDRQPSGLDEVVDELVTAPHVATVTDVVAVGTCVETGATLATIRVLDTEEDVHAPRAGIVTVVHVQKNALIEFKSPILSLGADVG